MLATIRDDTWNVLNMQHIIPNSKDSVIIQASPLVAMNRLKSTPTWLQREVGGGGGGGGASECMYKATCWKLPIAGCSTLFRYSGLESKAFVWHIYKIMYANMSSAQLMCPQFVSWGHLIHGFCATKSNHAMPIGLFHCVNYTEFLAYGLHTLPWDI